MQWSTERKISTGLAIALISLGVVGWIAYRSTIELISENRWVEHTHRVIERLESFSSDFSIAEAAQRGYVITGNARYLDSYYLSTASIGKTFTDIRQLTSDNSSQQQQLQEIEPEITRRLEILAEVLATRQQNGFTAAKTIIERDIGRQLTAKIRQKIEEMLAQERYLLTIRADKAQQVAKDTKLVIGLSGLLAFVLGPLAAWMLNRDLHRQRQVERKLQESEFKLKQWVSELEQRSHEISQLGKLSDILQACFTLEEAYNALGEMMKSIFPETSGGVFIINESKILVDAVATWGEHESRPEFFSPSECWALRRGRIYLMDNARSRLHCQHLKSPLPDESLCVPMMAQGEALGILHLVATRLGHLTQNQQQLATTVSETIAIALANLKLREMLKNQSIRDPLTGLFNRRYMEESLDREILRAERTKQPLSIIMLDVDYFKRFNDTFGHEAGDIVLRELGQLLKRIIRGSDIACRYGGEEFMLLLPDVSLEIARQRAEQLRCEMKKLNLEYRRQALGVVTLSLGIAVFPSHGDTASTVVREADAALYRAKSKGRDRVAISDS